MSRTPSLWWGWELGFCDSSERLTCDSRLCCIRTLTGLPSGRRAG